MSCEEQHGKQEQKNEQERFGRSHALMDISIRITVSQTMEFRWQVKERARTYISRMPDSVRGEGGSVAMFKVAVALMRGSR